ncbi:hypothetical protein [Kribbella flavida]|uniref:hypothetical protein n=1 Tax=Kribbella flavida TaxID=182640 RepID=UPI00059CEEA8|nr:hypothetical protein [Kribbella flavida]
MRIYLLTSPRWILGVIIGLASGILIGLVARFDIPLTWPEALVCGAVIGSLLGVTLVFSVDRQRRQLRAAAGDLPPQMLAAAHRAAGGGPIPVDADVRGAAAKIAAQQLLFLRRNRSTFIVFMTVLVVSTAFNVLDGFGWGTMVPIVVGAATIAFGLYWPRRLRDRIQQLSVDGHTQPPDNA